MPAHRRNRTAGQALVETALFSVVLLYLLVGAVDMGRFLFSQITVTQAAKDGARKGAAYPKCRATITDYASVTTHSSSSTYNSIDYGVAQAGQSLGLGSTHITVTYYSYDKDAGTRTSSGTTATTGGQVDVKVTYPFTPVLPFFSTVVGIINAEATATHIIEAAPAGC